MKSDGSSSSVGQMEALPDKKSTEPWRDFDRSETPSDRLDPVRFRADGSSVNLSICLQVEGVHG